MFCCTAVHCFARLYKLGMAESVRAEESSLRPAVNCWSAVHSACTVSMTCSVQVKLGGAYQLCATLQVLIHRPTLMNAAADNQVS